MALQRVRSTILAGACAWLALGSMPVAAKEKDPPATPAEVQRLYDCRGLVEPGERLACFDRQVAALQQAEQSRQIAIFDKAAQKKAQRGLFGFTIRDLPFFGGGDDDDKDEVKRLETTVKWARREGYNKMRFEIEDGAVWIQTDQTDLPRDPKPGEKVVIYPGAVGGYFAELGNMKRIRVRRER